MDLGLSHNQREASFKDGCLSLRQAALEKQSSRLTPGPVYNPNVSCSSTTKNKLRNITFGSGPARFDSVPDVKNRPSTPGPHEYCPKKILAAKGSPSRPISFGSATRACNADNPSSKLSPGPSEYDPESIRRGWSFTRRGSSNVKFGTAKSLSDKKSCSQPGVGPQTYDPDAIRRGIMFTRRSNIQSVTFGRPSSARPSSRQSSGRPSSARPSSARPSSRRGSKSSTVSFCDEQPGPQQYDTEAIRQGVYSLSTKRRPSGIVFTTGPRTYNDAEERERASKPGPCTYQAPSSLGKQANSRHKNQPALSFGAR
ncbi:hypothetical protein QTG54_013995 [Skeletonema marinoi]|uniref:Uncharacterized protein n=1 Tax=Skeletonema marinoi TaxID=267567 RepID=A0AAD8XWV1_9STRA|nr:hypothetical protein QTG54_013995 [Skeletonema marinoi]|eukprot:scaffold12639_cov139-Skeletonema_marinoi.AAC.6